MAKVVLNSKEFKAILKTFVQLGHQQKKSGLAVVLSTSSPTEFRMLLSVDNTLIEATPQASIEEIGPIPFAFDPEPLLPLVFPAPTVTFSWKDKKGGSLSIKSGNFSTDLNIAVEMPAFSEIPQTDMKSFSLPLGLLGFMNNYLSIPHAYLKAKKEYTPVRLMTKEGKLVAYSDDGYSLAKVSTEIPVPFDFDIQIPKYIMDCLYDEEKSEDLVKIGVDGHALVLTNKTIKVFTAGMNDALPDFDQILGQVKDWATACKFQPRQLFEALNPLVAVIPSKDQTGAFITMSLEGHQGMNEKMNLKMNHKQLGNANVDKVEGVTEVYNEKCVKQVFINMHPLAFIEYTDLLIKLKDVLMFACNNMVQYSATHGQGASTLKVQYLFPTVQV